MYVSDSCIEDGGSTRAATDLFKSIESLCLTDNCHVFVVYMIAKDRHELILLR
jgi:hypothetical protein